MPPRVSAALSHDKIPRIGTDEQQIVLRSALAGLIPDSIAWHPRLIGFARIHLRRQSFAQFAPELRQCLLRIDLFSDMIKEELAGLMLMLHNATTPIIDLVSQWVRLAVLNDLFVNGERAVV